MFKAKVAAVALTLAAMAPGAAIMYAPSAFADQQVPDVVFIDLLCEDAGICKSGTSLVNAALKLCDDMRDSTWYTDIVAAEDIWTQNPDLTSYQAGYFVGASMANYCPEQLGGSTYA